MNEDLGSEEHIRQVCREEVDLVKNQPSAELGATCAAAAASQNQSALAALDAFRSQVASQAAA
eukprot:6636461-Pyramimonas_sp.AAC.1